MVNVRRVSMIAVVIACFVGAQGNATVFAGDDTSSLRETPSPSSLTHGTSELQPPTGVHLDGVHGPGAQAAAGREQGTAGLLDAIGALLASAASKQTV